VIPADEKGLVNLSEDQRASLSITALGNTFGPPRIHVGAFVINASLSLDLTVEEARAVIAQLESVIQSVANEVIA
jgi:hypothetical protein